MDTLQQIMEIDPGAADLIATLRASAEGTDRVQKGGWRGVMVAKFAQHGVTDDDRHAFCEAAFGHASSNDLEPRQCRATAYWLDDGGAAQVARVARAFLRARGQLDLPGGIPKGAESALERPQSVLGAFGEGDAALHATIEELGAVVRPIENKEATMSEEQATHWTQDAAAFWAWTVDEHSLAADEVLEALGVGDLAAFTGTKTDALHAVNEYAETTKDRRFLKELGERATERDHTEATTIAFCTVYDPGGLEVHVTARQGATVADVALTLLSLQGGVRSVLGLGWSTRPVKMFVPRDQPNTQAVSPPPPTKTAPPPTGAQAPAAQPGDNGGGTFQTETVKITAPKGKPVVEFWRAGRQYPEITWMLGGERLMEIAPSLAAAGWGAGNFDDIGQEYGLPLSVTWVPSPKNPKWKDIVAVALR